MNRGTLHRSQTWRRAVARMLVVALVLPALLGLLPGTPLSAEQALALAITQSFCGASGQKAPVHSPVQHDQSCILCAAGCATTHAADLPRTVFTATWQAVNARPLETPRAETAPPPPWRSIVVPRGPPAI